jgi:hypothetical protein
MRMEDELTTTIRAAMPLAALLGFEAVEGSPAAVVVRGAGRPSAAPRQASSTAAT